MKHVKKGPTQRQLRVGEQLRHIIAETMSRGHFSNELLLDANNVTVSEVRITPDLRNATAYVASFVKDESLDEVIEALNQEARVFQKEIGRQLNMKFTPRVRFREDDSFEEAGRIESLLHDIHRTTNIDRSEEE